MFERQSDKVFCIHDDGLYHQVERVLTSNSEDDKFYTFKVCWSIWYKYDVDVVTIPPDVDQQLLCPKCFNLEDRMKLVANV